MTKPTKIFSIILLVIIVFLTLFIYTKFYFVFGEGVKAGELNYFVHKGYIFKTYEGKMIQTEFRGKQAGTIQSYEFTFSVVGEEVAEKLMRSSGKTMELRYKEYLGALPWRGYSRFVVVDIVAIHDDIEVGGDWCQNSCRHLKSINHETKTVECYYPKEKKDA